MADIMDFPATVEEFMEQYKIVDSKEVYTNGSELVPIFRMKQWFDHVGATDWIPCSSGRMPEEPFGCIVTVWDTDPVTMDEFENLLPYFVGWDGEQWNDSDGEQCPFEVIAWCKLPAPYKGGDADGR